MNDTTPKKIAAVKVIVSSEATSAHKAASDDPPLVLEIRGESLGLLGNRILRSEKFRNVAH